MIEIVILYILSKYDATIYRLSKIIDEYFFAYLKSSTGTISPALKRLEKLNCVDFEESMTKGGMLSKTYSITPTGKKHLTEQLLTLKEPNPYHVLNTVKIAIYCSDSLSVNEIVEFKENLISILEILKIKIEKGTSSEYVSLNEIQKQTIKITMTEIESLIKLL